MKFGIRKPSIKKKIAPHNPITKAKKKCSVKKYTHPIETTKKRVYDEIYDKTTVSIWDLIDEDED